LIIQNQAPAVFGRSITHVDLDKANTATRIVDDDPGRNHLQEMKRIRRISTDQEESAKF
jgi:hypothetical protein